MADSHNDLISFVASMTGEGNLRVEENFGEGFVRLRISEAERRQAKHDIQHVEDIVVEMLRNARDAGASKIYVATAKEDGIRTILFIDNGSGVPENMQERIFDARVTSKLESMKMDKWGVHGRGMALFSIKQNVDTAEVVASGSNLGSSFRVVIQPDTLSERADQSSWPKVEKNDEGVFVCVKGPHNIPRTTSEFALEELRVCDVYLGSPTEIAATLYAHAQNSLDQTQLLFIDDETTLPVYERLGCAADASDFIRIASQIGIDVSERTAHRILAGSIEPLRSVSARLLRQRTSTTPKEVDLIKDRRGLKISQDDLKDFSRVLERDFSQLAEKYYVNLNADPKIRVHKDKITVTFEIDKGE